MIAYLQGSLIDKTESQIVINIGGIGYLIDISLTTFVKLPELGQDTELFIHTIVREDAFLLYGFFEKFERECFKTLIKVNGVGPKLALGVLSNIDPQQLAICVANHDVARLVKLPGIGKKTAERLLIEIKDKFNKITGISFQEGASSSQESLGALSSSDTQDAISALITLGYKATQARIVVNNIASDDKSSEQLIREALQYMMQKA